MKIFVTIILFISAAFFVKAQDIIILKNGDEISSKITEVNVSDIKYKKVDNLEGPTYSVLKSDIFMIKYKNGSKDIFNQPKENSNENAQPKSTDNMFYQGETDATKYYRGYKGAGTGTCVATLFVGVFGLIPAIACSSTPPSDENLMYPSNDLMKNMDYNNGYRQNAKRIKSKKVWGNFGIALAIDFVAILIITSGNTGP